MTPFRITNCWLEQANIPMTPHSHNVETSTTEGAGISLESHSDTIVASIVIPSSDGDRGGNVALLLDDLRAQDMRDMEIILVTGVTPQGKAINQGVARARGEYLVILDDDSRVRDSNTIGALVNILKEHSDIGMVGASIVQPLDAPPFQRRVAREFPRFNMPVVEALTDSDMPCHGCCGFRRAVFDQIGGEPENILRGLDPILRHRLREHGYRVVLAPHLAVSHPVPGSWRSLLHMFFRNGRGSAYAQRHSPAHVFDTHESTEWQGKTLHTPLWKRLLRYPLRTLKRLLTGDYVRGLGDFVYAFGYLYERAVPRD